MQDGTQSPNIGSDGFVTIPDVSVDAIANRVLPRQTTSGDSRGTTQRIVNIDGSYVSLGLIPDGGTDFGIAFFDANGNLISKNIGEIQYLYNAAGKNVIQFGKLSDGSTALKFFDSNGVGLAQFGTYPDGSTELKVAQANIEVSTATDSQLVFNSNKSFTVIASGTFTFPSRIVAGSTQVFATTQPIPHNAGYDPAVACYAPPFINASPSDAGYPPDFPANTLTFQSTATTIVQSESLSAFNEVFYGVDSTNLYLGLSYANGGVSSFSFAAIPITYYVYSYRVTP